MSAPYIFRYRELDPFKIRPIGDRYMVELLETDEVSPAGILIPERAEQERGWHAAVVFSMGNGHRLDVPDPVCVMPEPVRDLKEGETVDQRAIDMRAMASYSAPFVGTHSMVVRPLATVAMFFVPGEVIFVEKYSGREFHIGERRFRFVSQVDCLGTSGRFLVLSADGSWSDAPDPSAAPANGKPKLYSA